MADLFYVNNRGNEGESCFDYARKQESLLKD